MLWWPVQEEIGHRWAEVMHLASKESGWISHASHCKPCHATMGAVWRKTESAWSGYLSFARAPCSPAATPGAPNSRIFPAAWVAWVQSIISSHLPCLILRTSRTLRYHVVSPSTHEGRLIHPAYREQEQE